LVTTRTFPGACGAAGAGAASVTVTVFPAIVSVPTRCVPVLADTEKTELPLPLPLAPLVTVNQLALLVAVQPHPVVVVTVTVVEPPALVGDVLVGDTVKVHGAAACVTVNVRPATVSVPARENVNTLAATE
jgi:hypothetical protein